MNLCIMAMYWELENMLKIWLIIYEKNKFFENQNQIHQNWTKSASEYPWKFFFLLLHLMEYCLWQNFNIKKTSPFIKYKREIEREISSYIKSKRENMNNQVILSWKMSFLDSIYSEPVESVFMLTLTEVISIFPQAIMLLFLSFWYFPASCRRRLGVKTKNTKMPEVLTSDGPMTSSEEPDFTMFENKTGLAEDLKFLASIPELCDVTFLVGETREPVCAVKVCR